MAIPAPPVIGKWISTRRAGPYLSGQWPINAEARLLGLKERDVAAFARALAACPVYAGHPIYRGVFRDDPFYRALLLTGIATTDRYYSFAKTKEWGEAYGDKIVLTVTTPAYDISKWSRESEVVVGKRVTLREKSIVQAGLFTYVFLVAAVAEPG